MVINMMNKIVKQYGIEVNGYREFDDVFPISPTTLKPKTRYIDGFINYSPSGQKVHIDYSPTDKKDVWKIIKHME